MLADRAVPLLRVNPTPMVAMVGLASTQAASRQRLPRGQVSIVWVPPSGHVAGVYARVDNERGVHKAPANEIIRGALSLKYNISKGEQDILNPKGINCIRTMQGGGRGLGGAREAVVRRAARPRR